MNTFKKTLHVWTWLMLCTHWGASEAQVAYPNKPIKMVVPYAAGGPNDVMARIVSQQLGLQMGQSVIVENKLGAGGVIGTQAVAEAAGDGYTLGFISGPFTMAPALQPKLPYDTLKDLAPITKVAESPMAFMVPSTSKFKSIQELIDFAKDNPLQLNYGSGGIGSTPHLTTEFLSNMVGIKLTHVPYKGGGESIKALMASEIDLLIDSVTSTDAPMASGRIRLLAIANPKRIPKFASTPTLDEAGIHGFELSHWVGIVAPAKISPAVLNTLHAHVLKALKAPEVIKRLHEIGAEPVGNSAADFEKFIAKEVANWQKTVKAANIQAQ